eukprot:2042348-Prorocentrum_lima.AAC.1
MRCSTCNSEYHLRRWCPEGKGKGCKSGSAPSCGGLSSTLHSHQVSGGLSEFPGAPRSGIMTAWVVSN